MISSWVWQFFFVTLTAKESTTIKANVKLNRFALAKAAEEAIEYNWLLVNEEVFTAITRINEAKALLFVEQQP